ncbi:MAG: MBL fold metallo-hydrolase [Clostridia bacterium]|nr:MBL fold metallo-hydrolase [Clostridia bacterium]
MPKKSFVTSMPDKAGAFQLASRIIAGHGGNIVRASYNKAVDLHTLFIDVEANHGDLEAIERGLKEIGYLNSRIPETRVIVVEIQIPDVPGAVLPVLEILSRYDINISYLNSAAQGGEFQNFRMGLLLQNPKLIRELLGEISRLYRIDIIDYDENEQSLDNTIFYLRLAGEMRQMLGLTQEKTMEFIAESNRILQAHEETGENPARVFETIRRFAGFISAHRGGSFNADIERVELGGGVTLTGIEPPCGSNTYVLEEQGGRLTLVDTGYAIYAPEMFDILEGLFPQWRARCGTVCITHADVDHCGLLSQLGGVRIRLSQKSAESLMRQRAGEPDYRERRDLGFGYSRLSRIISGYTPPDAALFDVLGSGAPGEHDDLLPLGRFSVGGLEFEALEGSGGHICGETAFICRGCAVAFTGDNLVNISGFSPERAEFNSLAPYLMRSVNIDSEKATEMRRQLTRLIRGIPGVQGRHCLVCGGHGPLSVFEGGRLVRYADAKSNS